MTTALVVGKFAPLHRGHEWLLDRALEVADQLVVMVWSNPDWDAAPSPVRAEWVRRLQPNALVIVPADPPPDDAGTDIQCAFTQAVLDRRGISIDVVVSGESYGTQLARTLDAAEVRVDRTRLEVSGTLVREDIHRHRAWVSPLVYAHFVELVAVMGAESTGKSTFARALAGRLGTEWVHEYGREHYENKQGDLGLADYVEIARVHREREDQACKMANQWVISDTNAITTMMFSHLYERDSLDELRQMASDCSTRYRHVIVCDDDIPFEQDGWRDSSAWRARMQGLILADLTVRSIPFVVVSGSLEQRLDRALDVLAGRVRPSLHPPAHPGGLGPRPS